MRSRNHNKYLAGILTLAAIVVTVVVWWQREHPGGGAPRLLPPGKAPSDLGLEVAGVNGLIIRANGKKQWELTAKKITVSKHRDLIEVKDLSRAIYYRNEKPLLTFSAKRLRFNLETRNLEITGQVSVQSIHGLMMTTSLVRWDAAHRKLVCPRGVEARVKRLAFKTNLVILTPDSDRLTCPNPVRVTFGGGGFLRANRLVANLASETVEMIGGVFCKARIGPLKLPFSL